jgi:hypothetical protein
VIENAASELLGLPFDEEGADSEFRDTLEKLQEGGENAPSTNCKWPSNSASPA